MLDVDDPGFKFVTRLSAGRSGVQIRTHALGLSVLKERSRPTLETFPSPIQWEPGFVP